ncbi:MAG: hypothetical protein L0H53_11070 [Candidatus Nitrosocosmicus sp.]|nr:hypothetical protein [Candidatus Nitrosocosmicus sp.]
MHRSTLFIAIVLGLFVPCLLTIISSISYGQSSFGSNKDFSLDSLFGNNFDLFGDNSNVKSDQTKLIDFTVNETSGLKTHVNPDYKFVIQYPLEWEEGELSNDLAFLGSKEIFRIGDASNNPNPMRTSSNTVVTINVESTSQSLNPNTLQVESVTARDYANKQVEILSGPMDFGSMQATHDITKNTPATVSGQSAWRIDYITNIAGVQSSYQSEIYTVNNSTLYEIGLFTDPLKVPAMLPVFNQIVNSFRFVNDSYISNYTQFNPANQSSSTLSTNASQLNSNNTQNDFNSSADFRNGEQPVAQIQQFNTDIGSLIKENDQSNRDAIGGSSTLNNQPEKRISLKLNSAEFQTLDSSDHQAKILVDYEVIDPTLSDATINGVLEITDLDGNEIKATSYPDGFRITESGIIQFASTVDDEDIDTVNLRV